MHTIYLIYLIYFSFLPSDHVDQFQLSCEVSYLGKESFVWVMDLRSTLSVASLSSLVSCLGKELSVLGVIRIGQSSMWWVVGLIISHMSLVDILSTLS